jgi:hypothetical protein
LHIGGGVADVQSAAGLKEFSGIAVDTVPARALIKQFIDWWQRLEPVNEAQQDAHGRLPAAIRLLDTISSWMAEQARRQDPHKT